MFKVKQTGVVKKNREEAEIEFQITDFFSIAEEECSFLKSPSFSFAGASWRFEVHHKSTYQPEFIKVKLNIDEPLEYPVKYEFGLKKLDGSLENLATGALEDDLEWSGSCSFKMSDIKQRQFELAPSNIVTIKCVLKLARNQPDLLDELKRRKRKRAESVCQDYKKLFLDGQNHDIILKVGDKEFSAHRDILMARSHVFESMLSHNMLEKNSGVIDVHDCDPQSMQQLLLYVYCGEVDNLDGSNMLGLYYAADKYELGALKEECCEFIKKTLCTTNICKIIQLAVNHDDSDLLEHSTEFFRDNSQNILRTAEWQSFMINNFTTANELLIEYIDKLKNEKS